jgi:hypothetical protein
LSVEAVSGGVIPDQMVSLRDFRAKVELSGDDLRCHLIAQTTLRTQALTLSSFRACHDYDALEMLLRHGFEQQRDINNEPLCRAS